MLKTFDQVLSSGVNLQGFEADRQEAQRKTKSNLMIGGIIGAVILIVGIVLIISKSPLGFIIAFVGIITFFVYWGISSSSIKNKLKLKIFTDVIKLIDPNLTYKISDAEFQQQFRKSAILKSYSSLSSDDTFRGTINNMPYGIGEVKAIQKTDKSSHTVFHGPFYFVQTNNTYPFTSIIPDYMEKGLGKVGAFLQKADLTRLNQKNIRIDQDPNFEKYYAVWTKEEGFARNILNDQLRNHLVSLNGQPVYLGFRDNFIYFGIDNRSNLFEIKLKEPITEQIIQSFYNDFANYYNILEELLSKIFSTTSNNTNQSPDLSEQPPAPPSF